MAAMRTEVSADHGRSHVSRLGHNHMTATVHTWRTRVEVGIDRDGVTMIRVTRDGETVHTWSLDEPEGS